MTQNEIDEIERQKSQKQKEQWRDYVEDSLKHPLDNRYSSQVVQDHIDKENEEMTKDPVGYERRHTPKSTLPLGNKDEVDDQGNIREIISKDSERQPLEKEEVTNPTHYNERKIEPLDYIIANELDFLEGNIIKYVTRYTYKGGVNDLLKARTYLEKLIERERDGR